MDRPRCSRGRVGLNELTVGRTLQALRRLLALNCANQPLSFFGQQAVTGCDVGIAFPQHVHAGRGRQLFELGCQRFSGFSQPRQCGEEVLRILVTGGPPVRGGGGIPQRIRTSSRSAPALRTTGAG
jgi:hypothetical protein